MNKRKIDEAICIASRTLDPDWEFYLSCLFTEEVEEANQETIDAFMTLEWYGIPKEVVEKHHKRQENKEDEPMRFIDKPHFIAIETKDLPI